MGWKKRLLEIALAGGTLACSSEPFPGGPCGNGSSDPCICDRPAMSLTAKQECDFKHACEGDGGIYEYGLVCEKPDAGTDGGH